MLAEREVVVLRREHERYHPAVVQAAPSAGALVLVGVGRAGRLALLVCACALISLGAIGQLLMRELEGDHGES